MTNRGDTSIYARSQLFKNVGLAGWLLAIAVYSLLGTPVSSLIEVERICYMVGTACLVVLALGRPPPVEHDSRSWVVILCVWSMCYSLFYTAVELESNVLSRAVVWARVPVLILADITLLSLGRSFAVLPAARRVRTGFLYRCVRHPVYALYMLSDALFLALQPCLWNGLLAVSGAVSFWLRAKLEERLLLRSEAYAHYARKVRWRFLPFMY